MTTVALFNKCVSTIGNPYQDKQGNVIQLWKFGPNHFASVLGQDDDVKIIPGNRILNPLNPEDFGSPFIERITKGQHRWDFVLDVSKAAIQIWPHLIAAGRNEFKAGDKMPDGFMKMYPLRHLTPRDLCQRMIAKSFIPKGRQPEIGEWSYTNPRTGRAWRLDLRDRARYAEPNHVDIQGKGEKGHRFALKDDYYDYGPPKGPQQ